MKSLSEMVFNEKTQKHKDKCKECQIKLKEEQVKNRREWKFRNIDRIREINKRSDLKNAKKKKDKRDSKKDQKSAYDKERRKNRKRDFKKERERDKERRHTDPFHRMRFCLRRRTKKAFKAAGYTKRSKSENIIGINWNNLVKYFLETFGINVLDKEYMADKHTDHICPLAQARTEEELIKLCHYTNLQILTASKNVKKSDTKTPEGEVKCRELLGREWIDD
jgi:hypothetical protein